jgi:opacity protein-like surface antigen
MEKMMKYLAILLTFIIAAQANAEAYVGISGGGYLYDQDLDGSGDLELRDYTLGLFGGYAFNDWIGAEASYQNFLEGGDNIDNTVIVRGKGDSWNLLVRPTWRISHDFELYAKLGIAFWNTDFKVRIPDMNFSDSEDDNGQDFTWGVGGRWWGSDRWSLAAEFNRIEADSKVQFDVVTMNLAYHF